MTGRPMSAPQPGLVIPGRLIGICVLGLSSAVGLAALVSIGPAALIIPIMALVVVLAAVFPRAFVYLLLAAAIVIEPGAIDFTKPIAYALWSLPEGVRGIITITVSPMELALVAAAASLWIRGRGQATAQADMPRLVYFVPVVILLGFAYGARRGGDLPLAYNEARGLLFAIAAFFIALRMAGEPRDRILKVLFVASTLLALVTVNRWLFYTRSGDSPVPIEFAFAHENAVFFGIAVLISGMQFVKARSNGARAALLLHMLLMLIATFVTGRRAGTLMLLMGGATVAWLLFPKRPVAVLAVSLPLLLMGGAYLATYWNHEYGTIAQPARAIRSQISPSPRDASSDDYRVIERYNVEQTLKFNPLFGVGFGNPFAQFRQLPNLKDFWPLQDYTPHQNILWLWLKMGILGIAVFLGLWLVALKRCIQVVRSTPRNAPLPTAAITLAAILLMYFSYAQIDLALTGTRAIAPLAAALALCFRLRSYSPPVAEAARE